MLNDEDNWLLCLNLEIFNARVVLSVNRSPFVWGKGGRNTGKSEMSICINPSTNYSQAALELIWKAL